MIVIFLYKCKSQEDKTGMDQFPLRLHLPNMQLSSPYDRTQFCPTEVNIKNAFSEHAEQLDAATFLSRIQHSRTLHRFEDVFNQGTIIPRRAIQVLSDQSAVPSPDETRGQIRPPLSILSSLVLIRITVGITSAAPLPMAHLECTTANACARCN